MHDGKLAQSAPLQLRAEGRFTCERRGSPCADHTAEIGGRSSVVREDLLKALGAEMTHGDFGEDSLHGRPIVGR